MKIFAQLIAKLSGQAEAPKTLEQARATFGEAKSALDKVVEMFTAASLDFDALLTAGADSLRDHIAAITAKVTTAETALTEATGKVTAAEAKATAAEGQVTALNTQLSALNTLLGSIGFKPAADTKPEAFQAAWNAHIANGVTAKMAELGIKADKLPAAAVVDSENEADLQAALAKATTPAERGEIAAKLNKLRDAKPTGKN